MIDEPVSLSRARLLLVGAFAIYVTVAGLSAWMGDDGYITARTVDNFVHGYGLRWNVADRVQAYTHPLWMMALIPTYWVVANCYVAAVLLGMVCSVAAAWILAKKISPDPAAGTAIVAIMTLSRTLIDYSTSGLENAMTHLLIVSLLAVAIRSTVVTVRVALWAGLLACAAALNRLDNVLLVAPVLLVLVWRSRNLRVMGAVGLSFLPLLAWEVFSIIYYGFPFPNTAYAKLTTGLPRVELIGQGLLYLVQYLRHDPVGTSCLAGALAAAVTWRGSGRQYVLATAIGILAYVGYVIWIGGDFMAGRFFSASVFAAISILAYTCRQWFSRRMLAISVIAAAGLSFLAERPVLTHTVVRPVDPNHLSRWGICDERIYYSEICLFQMIADARLAKQISPHDRATPAPEKKVIHMDMIGYEGFHGGPSVHIVDRPALADAFLARLNPEPGDDWRPGHLPRAFPEGYMQTLQQDQNVIKDPALASLYDKISLITRGPIFMRERLIEIARMNLDH